MHPADTLTPAQTLVASRTAWDSAERTLNLIGSLSEDKRSAALRQALRDLNFELEAYRQRFPKQLPPLPPEPDFTEAFKRPQREFGDPDRPRRDQARDQGPRELSW